MKRLLGIVKEDKIIAPVGTQEFVLEMKKRYPDTTSEIKILDDSMYESVCRHDEINDTISKLKVEKTMIEHNIMSMMKAHDTAYIKERKISWKNQSKTTLDSKRIKCEEPEIYERYCRVTNSRVFKIK